MIPEENNHNLNSADSFEDLRRQLGLDRDEKNSVSLFDELMNDDRKKPVLSSDFTIESIQKMLEDDDDDEPEEPREEIAGRKIIVSESLAPMPEKPLNNKKKSEKKLRKEQLHEQKLIEKEARYTKARSAKNHEKESSREEKKAAKQRRKAEKLQLKLGKFAPAEPTENVYTENSEIASRNLYAPSEARLLAADIEKAVEGADSEEINNLSMYEFDKKSDGIKRKGLNKLLYNIFPNKKDPGKEKLRKVVSLLSVLTIIGCSIYFGSLFLQHQQQVSKQKQLYSYISEPQNEEEVQTAWEKIKSQYPDVKFPAGMNVKYAKLYALNNEFVGWLSIPNTEINVQIVQSKDNEKYLKNDFYGEYSRYGCPFMDARNNIIKLNMNTIIYGHNMKDGLMFAALKDYMKPEGFEKAPVVQLSTLYGDYTFKIYAVFISNSKKEDDNDYLFNYNFIHLTSDEAFESYIKEVDQRKFYDTGVDIKPGDKLLTLSTCTYEFEDARFVVLARLLRPGENPTSHGKVTVNSTPRYPAIWYEIKKQDNPFEEAERWYPS